MSDARPPDRPRVVPSRSCETCAWWTADSECRRNPPAFGRERHSTYGPWPTTAPDDWCAEWRLAAEAGEVEAMMRTIAALEGDDFETYTDRGRKALKGQASLWLSEMRRQGIVPIIVPSTDV